MKKNIFFATAMALCMGLSFTSCLDSNSSDTDTSYVGGFVKVSSSYLGLGSFKSPDGKTTITPSSASLSNLEQNGFKLANVNAAFIQGTYNKEENLDVESTLKFNNVNVTYAAPLDAPVEIVYERGAANDSVNTACIREIDNTNRTSNYFDDSYNKPWFFYDETTLVLPINYNLSLQKLHAFTLVFYASEVEQGDTSLKLSLKHYNAKENSSNYESYSYASAYPFAYFYAFDLSTAIEHWQRALQTSSEPTSVTIEYVASEYNNDLAQGTTKLLTVERKGYGQK
ncbi:MAG: hypothetical protein ACI4CA_02615 [Bacteroides sp.]